MRIERQDREKVVIVISPRKAERVLQALNMHADNLGSQAVELRQNLGALGVTAPPPSDHIRYEFKLPDE